MNLDTLITELQAKDERILELENRRKEIDKGLEELKSQLLDYGIKEDSLIITLVNNLKDE